MPDATDHVVAAWRRELPTALTSTSELSKRVVELGRVLTTAILDAVSPFGLTMAEYDVLAALRRAGEPYRLAPARLASELLLSSGGVTKALHALTDRGLVVRYPDPSDGRRSDVALTAAGIELAGRAVVASARAQHRVFDGVTSAGAESATAALRRIGRERTVR